MTFRLYSYMGANIFTPSLPGHGMFYLVLEAYMKNERFGNLMIQRLVTVLFVGSGAHSVNCQLGIDACKFFNTDFCCP